MKFIINTYIRFFLVLTCFLTLSTFLHNIFLNLSIVPQLFAPQSGPIVKKGSKDHMHPLYKSSLHKTKRPCSVALPLSQY